MVLLKDRNKWFIVLVNTFLGEENRDLEVEMRGAEKDYTEVYKTCLIGLH